MEHPPNSKKSKQAKTPAERPAVERVVSEEPTVRKKSLGRQFRETFIGGDLKNATHFMVFSVLVPAAKDALSDAGAQGLERLIYGETRMASRRSRSQSAGHINYNRMSARNRPADEPRVSISGRARQDHDFTEMILKSRVDAETVLERMFDILSKYEQVTLSDFYDLLGLNSNHIDTKWGWVDLRGATVVKVRNGYLLDVPDPEEL